MSTFRRFNAASMCRLVSWGGLVLALAACGSRPAQPPDSQALVSQPTEANAEALPPVAPTPASPAEVGPTSVPTAAPVRQELAATDPTGVVLGAGRSTLVEFFAFW